MLWRWLGGTSGSRTTAVCARDFEISILRMAGRCSISGSFARPTPSSGRGTRINLGRVANGCIVAFGSRLPRVRTVRAERLVGARSIKSHGTLK